VHSPRGQGGGFLFGAVNHLLKATLPARRLGQGQQMNHANDGVIGSKNFK
jgi:hypothetical protein